MPQRTAPLKVFLADDSRDIRTRIAGLLGAPAMSIVGQAETAPGCVDGILATRPDVVVLDVQLRTGSGLDVLRAVHGTHPEIAFVIFSNNDSEPYRKRYFGEGAVRFLGKSTEFDQLARAVAEAGALRTQHPKAAKC